MNFVKRYVQFASPITEASRVFHHYMAYAILGIAVGKRAYYTGAGSFPISPSFWMIFVGPSSITKKSTSLNIAMRHVLKHVYQDNRFRFPSEGSHESFMDLLEKQPEGVITHGEFANLKGWLSRDYNSALMGTLTDLYDQPDEYYRRVGTRDKVKEYHIKQPLVSILSCTTVDWFGRSLTEQEIRGGFLPRFILVEDVDEGNLVPESPEPDEALRADLVNELQFVRDMPVLRYQYDDSARQTYIRWYKSIHKDKIKNPKTHPLVQAFLSRRITDLHKFSMLHCLMRRGIRMNDDDLEESIGVIDNLFEYAESIISEKLALNDYQFTRNKVLELIAAQANQNGGAPHWTILKKSKMRGRDFNEIIQTLLEENTIVKNEEAGLSGRKKTFYKVNKEVA